MTAVRAARASILLVLVSVLSGCGLAGNGFQPGVGVLVDDRTISQRHISDLTGDYCSALIALEQIGTGASLRHLRTQFVVPVLSIRLAVEELAEELDVEPTEQYRTEVSSHRSQVAGLDDREAAAAWLEIESAKSFVRDVLGTIGEAQADSGPGEGAEAGDARFAAGLGVLAGWMVEGGEGIGAEEEPPILSINPSYGWRFAETDQEGPIVPTETEVSYAVSALAKAATPVESPQGLAENPAYLEDLPDRMVCR